MPVSVVGVENRSFELSEVKIYFIESDYQYEPIFLQDSVSIPATKKFAFSNRFAIFFSKVFVWGQNAFVSVCVALIFLARGDGNPQVLRRLFKAVIFQNYINCSAAFIQRIHTQGVFCATLV